MTRLWGRLSFRASPGITFGFLLFLPKAYHLLLRCFERQTFLLHTTLFSEFSLPVPILILIDGLTLVCSTLGLVGFYAKETLARAVSLVMCSSPLGEQLTCLEMGFTPFLFYEVII